MWGAHVPQGRDIGKLPHPISCHSLSFPSSAVHWEAWRRIGLRLMGPGSWLKGWRRGLASKSSGNRGLQGQGWWAGDLTNPDNVRGCPVEGGRARVGNYQGDWTTTKNSAASRPGSDSSSAIADCVTDVIRPPRTSPSSSIQWAW